MTINPMNLPVRNEKVIPFFILKKLDRIYRMDRIFFAFLEERQKASLLLRASFKSPQKRDLPFTLSSGKSENNKSEKSG
jgi:hypothetical protein